MVQKYFRARWSKLYHSRRTVAVMEEICPELMFNRDQTILSQKNRLNGEKNDQAVLCGTLFR